MPGELESVIESGLHIVPMRFQARRTAWQQLAPFPADLVRYGRHVRHTNVSSLFMRRRNFLTMGADITGLPERNRVFPSRSVRRNQADVPSQFWEKGHGIYLRLEPLPC
jgi:hypothetical protein